MEDKRLASFGFIGLCLVIFFTYCNTTVFYSFDVYLTGLGFDPHWRGLLIGASSLATIAAFLTLSPLLTEANAVPCARAGAAVLIACGAAYLAVTGAAGLLALRLACGAGFFLLSASCMTLLVGRIPQGRSGQAFGLYTVAILLPYSTVPLVFDLMRFELPLERGYFLMSLFLVPVLLLLPRIGRGQRGAPGTASHAPGYRAMLGDIAKAPVGLLLLLTAMYLTVFSSVFFLANGLFRERGFPGVGLFFGIQMACMIAVRVLLGPVFDRVRKMTVVIASFALTGASCVLIALAGARWQALAAAVIMGTGMGLGTPAMNALMFDISPPDFRGVNANLLTMAQQTGNFAGPVLGTLAISALGYTGFLIVDAAVCGLALCLCAAYAARGLDRGPRAGGAALGPDGAAARRDPLL